MGKGHGSAQSRKFFCLFCCNLGFVLKRARHVLCRATFRRPCEGKYDFVPVCAHGLSRDLVLPASKYATSGFCCCFVE